MEKNQNLFEQSKRINELLSLKDYTDIGVETNPVNLVVNKIARNFAEAGTFPKIDFVRGNRVTTSEQNFDSLLFPTDSIMRTGLHTYFLTDGRVLRTQMSYLLAETLESEQIENERLVFSPGLVFRKEGVHHQLDIWYLKKSSKQFTSDDVVALLNLATEGLISEHSREIKPKSLHYIENGYKLKVSFQGGQKTFLDGGVIAPQMFINADLDPNKYIGVAIGVSLDRLAMYVKGINDHRILRSEDIRIKKQLNNLEKYKEVSKYPSVVRDLSLCLETEIGVDNIRYVLDLLLDEDSRATIEDVQLISEERYENLPVKARERLDIKPNQKNSLVRFVLRSLDRTLTNIEVNETRDYLFNVINNLSVDKIKEFKRPSQDS